VDDSAVDMREACRALKGRPLREGYRVRTKAIRRQHENTSFPELRGGFRECKDGVCVPESADAGDGG